MYKLKNFLSREKIEQELELLSYDPYDNQNIVNEGNRLFKESRLEESLDLYRTAYANEPDNEMIIYNLAYILYQLQDYPEALNYFNLAVDLKPEFTEAIKARDRLREKIEKLKKYTMTVYG